MYSARWQCSSSQIITCGLLRSAIRKYLDCYCCNCLGERRWEGRPRSHLCKPIASVCHVTLRCEHALFLHKCFLASCFPLKLQGWCFETVSNKQRESHAVLDSIKENDFHRAFEALKKWWDHCIHSQGDYFEGDGSQNWVS
jgi:hypothetical protein